MPQTYAAVQSANSQSQPQAINGGTNLLQGDPSPKSISQVYDFGATGIPVAGYTTSLTQLIQLGNIKGIQTIFIDNSLNNGPILVSNPSMNQGISLPAGYQGYFSILAAAGSGNNFTITSTGTLIANVSYLNVQMPFGLWSALIAPPSTGAPLAVSDAILDALVIAARFNVRSINAGTTSVDRSSTITIANTSQQLLAANPNRRGYRIQNIDQNLPAEGLWVSETGVAAVSTIGSFGIAACASAGYPGGSYDGTSTGVVNIVASSAGHKFTCIEW